MAFVVLKSVLKFGVAMIKKFAILIIVDACLEQSFQKLFASRRIVEKSLRLKTLPL